MKSAYKTKPFEEDLHKKYDAIAKYNTMWIVQSLSKGVFTAKENEDIYGPDIKVYKNGKFQFYMECEVRNVKGWVNEKFPFKTIHFPLRKEKFAKIAGIRFISFNENTPYFFIVKGADILSSPVEESFVKYRGQQEQFYNVSVEKVDFYSILKT